MLHRLLADLLLLSHASFALFVVGGLGAIGIGAAFKWRWVRNLWFRLTHLAAIAFVVAESWLGIICPLTVWEQRLRQVAGDASYEGAFIAHWIQSLLFYAAPTWVFVAAYTAFAGLVVAAWVLVPPRR